MRRKCMGVCNKVTGEVKFGFWGDQDPIGEFTWPWKVTGAAHREQLKRLDPSYQERVIVTARSPSDQEHALYPGDVGYVPAKRLALLPNGPNRLEVRIDAWKDRDRAATDYEAFDPAEQFAGEMLNSGAPPRPAAGRRWKMDRALGRLVQEAIPAVIENLQAERDELAQRAAAEARVNRPIRAARFQALADQKNAQAAELQSTPQLDTHQKKLTLR